MWLANSVRNWEDRLFPLSPQPRPQPHDKNPIRLRYVTIGDGFIQVASPTHTAILDTLAATLPGYGSIPFILDEDFNIAQGLVRMAGVGKIVPPRLDAPLPPDVIRVSQKT